MNTVILEGWNEGLEKVSLSLLQVSLLGTPLKQAKTNVDELLDGKTVKISIKNLSVLNDFMEKARKIGVICSLEPKKITVTNPKPYKIVQNDFNLSFNHSTYSFSIA